MELIEYWKVIQKRLWLIAILVILAATGAIYYGQQEQVQYSTTATLFLNPMADNPMWPYLRIEGDTLATTYSDFIRDSSFTSLVADELGLSSQEVRSSLATDYDPDSQYFFITATHPDPDMAQDIANTTAITFIAENAARLRSQQQQFGDPGDADQALSQQQLAELQAVLQQELSYINAQIESVQVEIADLQGQPRSERLNERVRSLINELFVLRELRADVMSNMSTSITSEAPLPTEPVPRRTLIYALQAIVGAGVIGIGLVFLLEYLDYTVRTPDTLSTIYGIPTQSVIGQASIKQKKGQSAHPALITLHEPLSPGAEAFRSLRLGISITRRGSPVRSLLFTSALPGEGKTFVAANLALSMAQNGHRTILVDANLRAPALHRIYNLPQEPGLTNLVYDQRDDIDTFLQPALVDNLWLLTSGTLLPNSADLLGTSQIARLMQQLAAHADIVIYDSPAVASVTDAVVVAPRVDAVFQVVMAGRPRIDKILGTRTLLEHAGGNMLGPVLNGVKKPPRTGYYTPQQRSRPPEKPGTAEQPDPVPSLVMSHQQTGQIATGKSAADTE